MEEEVIFRFYSEFDAVGVNITKQGEGFRVTMVHDDPAIGTQEDDVDESFTSLQDALGRYNGLVAMNIEAYLSEQG